MVLGVNTSDAKDKVLEVVEQAGIEFPNILDTSDGAVKALVKYETLVGFSAVPMTYTIDRQGNVIDAWYGYQEENAKNALKKLKLDEHP